MRLQGVEHLLEILLVAGANTGGIEKLYMAGSVEHTTHPDHISISRCSADTA